MRRARRFFLLLLLPLLFGGVLSLTAEAKEPQDYLSDLYNALPGAAQDALPPDLSDAAAIQEALGVEQLFRAVAESLSGQWPSTLRLFSTLLGMTVFFAVAALLREHLGAGVNRAVECVLGLILLLILYDCFSPCLLRIEQYLGDLCHLSDAMAPVMAGLYLAGGNTATGLSGSGAMAGLSVILENLCVGALLPILRVSFGFLLVGAVGEVRTEGVANSLKHAYTTLLGFACVLVSASLALQNAIGSAADSFAMRSLKYALGNMIPLVGGTVSGSLSTVAASVSLIRATAGGGLLVAILLTLLPILTELLLSRFLLGLLADLAKLIGTGGAEKIFRGFRGILDCAFAALAFSSMLFLFITAIFMRAAVAV